VKCASAGRESTYDVVKLLERNLVAASTLFGECREMLSQQRVFDKSAAKLGVDQIDLLIR
jgi:hypothetical protein